MDVVDVVLVICGTVDKVEGEAEGISFVEA
jgi:hypothetical protein